MVACGLFWATVQEVTAPTWVWIYKPERYVPLQSVHVEAVIVDATAEVKITQRYINSLTFPIEASYVFPLDEHAAVCEFEAEINGKRIVGIAKEKNEARAEYNQAISRGDGAYLLEQEKADIFKAKVGNIPSGCEVSVSVKYVAEIKNELDKIRFVVPTNVAPRYAPYGGPSPVTTGSQGYTPYKLSLSVTCVTQGGFASIESPSHTISTSINGNMASVGLDRGVTELDKDFVLLIGYTNPHEPKVVIEEDGKGGYAAMLSICPHLEFADVKTELVFLIDRSGSMSSKVTEVRQAMQLFMRSLPADCFFNIIGFGSNYQPLFPSSTRYSDQSLNKATQYCSNIGADLGGTEIYQPLQYIFSQPIIPGYSRQVFVLTDGQVTNTEQVIQLVQKNNQTSRVFSLGIGNDVSHNLVEGMARAGKGTAFFVLQGERIEKKVMKQLKDATQPALTDVKINWGLVTQENKPTEPVGSKVMSLLSYVSPSVAIKPVTLHQAPYRVPPLYSDNIFRIYSIFKSETLPPKVSLESKSPDGVLKADIEVDGTKVIKGNLIHTLAARTLIRDLEEGSSYLHQGSSQPTSVIQNEIIRLGTTYGLTSKYTSFIAVEERSLHEKLYGPPPAYQQPQASYYYSPQVQSQFSQPQPQYRGFGGGGAPPPPMARAAPASSASYSSAPQRRSDINMQIDSVNAIMQQNIDKVIQRGEALDLLVEKSENLNEQSRHFQKSAKKASWGFSNPFASLSKSSAPAPIPSYSSPPPPPPASAPAPAMMNMMDPFSSAGAPPPPPPGGSGGLPPPPPPQDEDMFGDFTYSQSNKALDPRSTMVALLNLQSFQGSFNFGSSLFNIVSHKGENISSFSCVSGLDNELAKSVWATALAIAYFSLHLKDLSDEWEMAVTKAKKWLATLKLSNLNEILQQAQLQV